MQKTFLTRLSLKDDASAIIWAEHVFGTTLTEGNVCQWVLATDRAVDALGSKKNNHRA
jgi:hypothetical protein